MIEYSAILETYRRIDEYLAMRENEDAEHREKWTKARLLNDHAYFLMLFAQMERFINEEAKALVKRMKGMKDHDLAWDIIATKGFEDKYPFGNKVVLLLGTGSHIAREINEYYEVRCDIAHGVIAGVPQQISEFAAHISEIANLIGKQGVTQ